MKKEIKFVDLFCGIGGFRIALEQAAEANFLKSKSVFSCDIDKSARRAYENNFSETPHGDINLVDATEIPDHDILLAGFPCQAFSICGDRKGFDDSRGTLFFEIARILKEKKPKAFLLENVRQLKTHDGGNTFDRIMETLANIGYSTETKILNALDFGLPQKRERIFIVGVKGPFNFEWPTGDIPMKPLSEILEPRVAAKYIASEYIRSKRLQKREGKLASEEPMIWHENKSGHVSVYPYSCALRAGASHNYLLVNGQRRLTEREMLRLQGFPDSYKYEGSYFSVRKQAGNSLPVPVARMILENLIGGVIIKQKKYGSTRIASASKTKIGQI